jgi:hypothetical protein
MSVFINQSKGQYQKLRQEMAANTRLTRMVWLIGCILLVYVVVYIHDQNVVLQQEVTEVERQLNKVVSIGTADLWKTREDNEGQIRSTLMESCWRAPSAGIASADMQTLLQQYSTNFNISNARLTVANSESYTIDQKNAWLIRAQLVGKAERSALPVFVNAIEEKQAYFAVERLNYTEIRSGTIDLLVHACFLEDV